MEWVILINKLYNLECLPHTMANLHLSCNGLWQFMHAVHLAGNSSFQCYTLNSNSVSSHVALRDLNPPFSCSKV